MRMYWPSKRPLRARCVPEDTRIYAVGDVHGRADLLNAMLSRIDADLVLQASSRVIEVFLGDYIDRGPDSRGVLDLLVERGKKHEIVVLKGNHETFLIDFLHDPTTLHNWARNGGLATLMSYGLGRLVNAEPHAMQVIASLFDLALPPSHRKLLDGLKTSFTCGDYFFVHAGVRPGIPLERQREEDLLWIRDDFLLHDGDFGKIIVHGHTPVVEPEILMNRINIDTGAFSTGRLTCVVLERDQTRMICESEAQVSASVH